MRHTRAREGNTQSRGVKGVSGPREETQVVIRAVAERDRGTGLVRRASEFDATSLSPQHEKGE